MKKLLAISLFLVLVLTAVSCGGAGDNGGTTPAATTGGQLPAGDAAENFIMRLEEALEADGETTYECYEITGLSDVGKRQTELTIPATYQGKPVKMIADNAFEGCTNLRKLTINNNVGLIGTAVFKGASAMVALYVNASAEEVLIPGYNEDDPLFGSAMLDGANENIRIYVPADKLDGFLNDYFWGNYASLIEAIAD